MRDRKRWPPEQQPLYESLPRRVASEEAHEEGVITKAQSSHRPALLTAFVVFFLAEWLDLTQILTANLLARHHSHLSVVVGSVTAL